MYWPSCLFSLGHGMIPIPWDTPSLSWNKISESVACLCGKSVVDGVARESSNLISLGKVHSNINISCPSVVVFSNCKPCAAFFLNAQGLSRCLVIWVTDEYKRGACRQLVELYGSVWVKLISLWEDFSDFGPRFGKIGFNLRGLSQGSLWFPFWQF